MANKRDEFSAKTINAMAHRVGYRCSFPDCNVITAGPSSKAPDGTSNIGVAAHITAASPGIGACRYDPSLTKEERSSIDNGIWLCQNHAKLIDTDEVRFTVEKLTYWKTLAEAHSAADLAIAEVFDEELMPSFSLAIDSVEVLNDRVTEFIHDCALTYIWDADLVLAVRDVCVEIARNSLSHGNSRQVFINIRGTAICILDNAECFSYRDLINVETPGGGATTISMFAEMYVAQALLQHLITDSGGNEYRIILYAESLPNVLAKGLAPCVAVPELDDVRQGLFVPEVPDGCNKMHIIVVFNPCISDFQAMQRAMDKAKADPQNFVIHVFGASRMTSDYAARLFSGYEVRFN